MSAIKGNPNQKRISHGGTAENYVSIVATDPKNRAGMDVLPKALYPVSALPLTAETLDISPSIPNPELRIVKITGHGIRQADVLRFSTGANKGLEVPVEKVDPNYIYLAGEILDDPDGQDFYHMRHITLTIDELGALSVSPGAIQFIKDSTTQQVIKDTITAANTVGLPVEIVGASGTEINITAGDIGVQLGHDGANPDSVRIGDGTEILQINASGEATVKDTDAATLLTSIDGKDFATQTTLEAARVLLASLDGKDFSTETTLEAARVLLASLDGKDFATETTLTALAAEDFATETTLNAVLTKIIAAPATEAKQDTLIAAISAGNSVKKVLASAFAAAPTVPTATRYGTGVTVPASTTGLDLEILTKAGDNFTAYDASTGGNVIGRFTQAGGKIPCELAAGTTVYLQSDTGADFTASDLTINLIGA